MASVEDLSPEDFAKAAAWDPEEAHRKGDELELKSLEGFAEVEKLIRVSGAKTASISFTAGGETVTIRTKSGIPFPLRLKIERFFRDTEDGKIDTAAAGQQQAALMASLCLDAPWTSPTAWIAVDKATGYLDKAFVDAWAAILDIEGTVSKFRPKR